MLCKKELDISAQMIDLHHRVCGEFEEDLKKCIGDWADVSITMAVKLCPQPHCWLNWRKWGLLNLQNDEQYGFVRHRVAVE